MGTIGKRLIMSHLKIRCANCFGDDNHVREFTIRVPVAQLVLQPPKQLVALLGCQNTASGHYTLLIQVLKSYFALYTSLLFSTPCFSK